MEENDNKSINLKLESEDVGPLYSWEFLERIEYDRSKTWFTIAGIVLAGLFIFALWQESYLFALILIISTITFLYRLTRENRVIDVEIDELGITLHGRFFAFKEFTTFWVAFNPPSENDLYLEFVSPFRPGLVIPLPEELDPNSLRTTLSLFLPEDLEREGGTFGEGLRRRLKL